MILLGFIILNFAATVGVREHAMTGVHGKTRFRPAEIANYRSMGTTPAILGVTLAAGAVVALGLTLVASVRRRRRKPVPRASVCRRELPG